MSRFLRERHYKLVLPGIALCYASINHPKARYPHSLRQVINLYLDRTEVSYTQFDADEIESLYIKRYGNAPSPQTKPCTFPEHNKLNPSPQETTNG